MPGRNAAPALSAALLALCAACAAIPRPDGSEAAAPARDGSDRLRALLERYWEADLVLNPIRATAIGDDRYNDRLPNFLSAAHRAQEKALAEGVLAELATFDRAALRGQDRLSYDILRRDLALELEGQRFPHWMIPINQAGSLPVFFAQLSSGKSLHPFRAAKDYDDFLQRMDGMIVLIDQAIANLREGVLAGVVQPKVAMVKVVPQLELLAVDPPEKSAFWGAIEVMPASIAAADRERITAAWRAKVQGQLVPAYRKLHAFLRDEYLPRCRDTVGYSALPDGAAWYAYEAKTQTTTSLGTEEIHRLGLAEVARIRGEMEQVKRQVGFQGDLPAFFKHLEDDPANTFASPAQVLAAYAALKAEINARLPKLFDVFPKSDYEVREVEAYRAQSAAGGSYQAGTPDGKRPGVFYVNTFNLKAQPRYGIETLSLHEASPGHHFQVSIAQEVTGLPMFRRFNGYVAYQEGWALYAESIGKELGLFTDPLQWYGRLADEMLRAMRLVVDTGLHAKGWSREQAISYMRDNSSMAESDVVSEVERYIVWPGQALGYKVGQLAITRMRREAEQALGPRFDLRAFHRQVLIDGALPLDVLEAKLREWEAAQRGRPATG